MNTSTRSIFAAFAAIALTTACGSDSTGPTAAQQASTAALHFDSLFTQTMNAHGNDDNYETRVEILELLEISPAYGAAPTTVTVHTASGTEHWKGFIIGDHESGDPAYILVAYGDADAHTALLSEESASSLQTQTSGLIVNDTTLVPADSATLTASQTSLGANCTLQAGLTNEAIAQLASQNPVCNAAKFNAAFSMFTSPAAGVDPSLERISFTSQSFNGVRLVFNNNEGRRVHELVTRLRATLAAKRK